jgi:hypothetical protein
MPVVQQNALVQKYCGSVMTTSTRMAGFHCGGGYVIHHVNPQTGLNLMTDAAGNFVSGLEAEAEQLQNVLTRALKGGKHAAARFG